MLRHFRRGNLITTDELVHHGKMTKVKRYGWTMIDSRGRFMMIQKNLIQIDDSYQRNVNEAKVMEIASNWSWIAFGVAIVAERQDGTYWAIDAQHRIAAARRRADIDLLPCMVFSVSQESDEARGFLASNTLRKPLTGMDKYKALVMTGDAASVRLNEIVEKHGYVISSAKGSGCLRGVRVATSLVMSDAEAVDAVFEVMKTDLDRCYAHDRLIQSLFFLQTKGLIDLSDKRARSAIRKVGYEGLLEACARASAYHATGGAKVWAEGVANALNKGKQTPVCKTPASAE